MNEIYRNYYREIVENIFNRWSGLKLAVEHGMAKNGLQTAIDFVNYVTDSCTQTNARISEEDLIDLLEDIMDQEFDTICEDDSIKEISKMLVKYLELLKNSQLEVIKTEISQLPHCNFWIIAGNRINIRTNDDDSTSDDDDDDDEMNESSMRVTENSTAPSTSGSTMQVVVEEDNSDPGWTVVRKGKKK